MLLQQTRGSPSALVILAHYYTVALVVEPLFPEVGAAYFGSLSLGPIEEIARRLFSINVSQTSGSDLQTPLNLMEYPIDMVARFRSRMGWVQPARTASFPSFPSNPYAMAASYSSLSPYGNPAFTYSQEHLMTMPPDPVPVPAMSPLSLDPFSSHYLGIPSPSGFGSYHSPTSSNFGEGSVIYSDQGDDFALCDQGHGSQFGGTPPAFNFAHRAHDEPQLGFAARSDEALRQYAPPASPRASALIAAPVDPRRKGKAPARLDTPSPSHNTP